MRERNEKIQREADAAFAVATFLLNVLILLIFCVCGLLHTIVLQSNSLGGSLLSESVLQ